MNRRVRKRIRKETVGPLDRKGPHHQRDYSSASPGPLSLLPVAVEVDEPEASLALVLTRSPTADVAATPFWTLGAVVRSRPRTPRTGPTARGALHRRRRSRPEPPGGCHEQARRGSRPRSGSPPSHRWSLRPPKLRCRRPQRISSRLRARIRRLAPWGRPVAARLPPGWRDHRSFPPSPGFRPIDSRPDLLHRGSRSRQASLSRRCESTSWSRPDWVCSRELERSPPEPHAGARSFHRYFRRLPSRAVRRATGHHPVCSRLSAASRMVAGAAINALTSCAGSPAASTMFWRASPVPPTKAMTGLRGARTRPSRVSGSVANEVITLVRF